MKILVFCKKIYFLQALIKPLGFWVVLDTNHLGIHFESMSKHKKS